MKKLSIKALFCACALISMAAMVAVPGGALMAQAPGGPSDDCFLSGGTWNPTLYICARPDSSGAASAETEEKIISCQERSGDWNDKTGVCNVDNPDEESWASDIGTGLDSAMTRCEGAGNSVSNALNSMSRSLGLGTQVSQRISGALSVSKGNNRLEVAISGVVNRNVNSVAGKAGSAVNEAVGSATGAVSSTVGEAFGAVRGAVSSARTAAGEALKDIGSSIKNSFKSKTKDAVSSAIKDPGSLTDMADNLYDSSGILGGATGGLIGGSGPIPTDPVTTKDNIAAMKKKEVCENAVNYAIAQNILLPQAVSRAANYLNTGNNGMPYYAVNTGNYYAQVSNEKSLALIDQISRSNSPEVRGIVPDVIKAERAAQDNSNESFARGLEPDLYKVAGSEEKARNFIAGDSQSCTGYLRCLSAAAEPNNNDIGRFNKTMEKKARDKEKAEQEAKDELMAGQGMFPKKVCVDERVNDETGDKYCREWKIVTPAIANAALMAQVTQAPLESIRGVKQGGEQVSPAVSGGLANETYDYGFTGLSDTGGVATRIGEGTQGAVSQAMENIATAVANTQIYQGLLNRGASVASKIVEDLQGTNACYATKESAFASATIPAGAVERPAAFTEEFAKMGDYQYFADEYRRQLAAIANNPLVRMPEEMVGDLALQVDTLVDIQKKTADYLNTCMGGKSPVNL